MTMIELSFSVLGSQLPSDHGYALYGALVKTVPKLHDDNCPVRIGSIAGIYVGKGTLQLDPAKSRLRLRLSTEEIPAFLPLAGKSLSVAGQRIRLGVPQVRCLIPAPNLIARLVVIKASSPKTDPAVKTSRTAILTKRYLDPVEFLAGARKQLDALEIKGEPAIPLTIAGPTEQHAEWEDLRSIGMVLSERQEGDKEPSIETRVFISSMPARVKRFARAVRNHWGIETSLHWVLDVSFREDASRLRKNHGQANMGLMRRLAVSYTMKLHAKLALAARGNARVGMTITSWECCALA